MSTVPTAATAAYETLRDAVRAGRLTAAQIDALLAILGHLHISAGLLATADELYPQYRDDPHMRMAVRAGLAEAATNSYSRELDLLAEAPRLTVPPVPLTPAMCDLLDWYAALDDGAGPTAFPVRPHLVRRTRAALVARGLVLDNVPHGSRRLTDAGRAMVERRAAVVELAALR